MRGSYENRLHSQWPRSMIEATDQSGHDSGDEVTSDWKDQLKRRMGGHPKTTLAAAAILGVLVGWMIKRK